MSNAELTWLPAMTLAGAIRRRELSPLELVDAYLARIDAVDGRCHGFLTLDAEGAREAARRAEREIAAGQYRGHLHGIPYALKDIYATKGIRTTAGSKILADYVPGHSSAVHERLQAAGALLLGKANTHEFAWGPAGAHPCHPLARNPWDVERITGGSSSGSAVATAAGMCPIAMGSCTGGSIRIPAALCGVVGLKPTYGRVSRHGVIPLSWSLDHVGPLGRTVADCAAALAAVAGPDPRDPAARDLPVPDYLGGLEGEARGLRIGLVREMWAVPMEPEVRRLARAAVDALAALGLEVEELSLPLAEDAYTPVRVIMSAESVLYHSAWLNERAGDYGPGLAARFLAGAGLTAPDLVLAHRVRRLTVEQFRQAMRSVDLLVSPTVPFSAPRSAEETVDVGDGRMPWRAETGRLTRIYNLTGLPAISVPCGFAANGMPVGLQIAARPFDEATLLRVANIYSQATRWSERRPALA